MNIVNLKLAVFVALLLCMASAVAGPDAVQRKFALMSLIGNSLTVVTHRPNTGALTDQNTQEIVDLPDAAFDRAALLAMDDALRAADSNTSAIMISPSSAALRTEQGRLLDGQRFVSFQALDEVLNRAGATHLMLVTKHRAETALQTANFKTGSGMLEGLGFYIDRDKPLTRSDTGQRGIGFLAPYAYFKISLVDLATSTVQKEQAVTATTTRSAARSKDSVDPWDALSPTQKTSILRGMITREIARAVPALIQSQ